MLDYWNPNSEIAENKNQIVELLMNELASS